MPMAAFVNDPAEWQRTDYRLLQNGVVSLFWSDRILLSTVDWLIEAGYLVVELDAQNWSNLHDTMSAIGLAFDFPAYFGDNLDAFNDCLGDVATYEYGSRAETTGTALVLRHYDAYANREPD